jgi:DNA integrity scanning protein DisA with diadenylate cyclase activity
MSHQVKTVFDILMIKENIISLKSSINKLVNEGTTDPFDIEMKMIELYPEFYQEHPFLVKKLCKQDDISMVYKMLDNLEQVEQGMTTLSNVEIDLGQQLADQYLSPVLNKK